jgi:hypothetical protein
MAPRFLSNFHQPKILHSTFFVHDVEETLQHIFALIRDLPIEYSFSFDNTDLSRVFDVR